MDEVKGWTIFGVAALAAVVALLLGAMSCEARSTASRAEACKAVMGSGDAQVRLLATTSGGVCRGNN